MQRYITLLSLALLASGSNLAAGKLNMLDSAELEAKQKKLQSKRALLSGEELKALDAQIKALNNIQKYHKSPAKDEPYKTTSMFFAREDYYKAKNNRKNPEKQRETDEEKRGLEVQEKKISGRAHAFTTEEMSTHKIKVQKVEEEARNLYAEIRNNFIGINNWRVKNKLGKKP